MKHFFSKLLFFFCIKIVLFILLHHFVASPFSKIAPRITGVIYEPFQIGNNIQAKLNISKLDLCQSTNRFITFRDVNDGGSGLLHKFDDFLRACIIAIRTDRTLIDYAPGLNGKHLGKDFMSDVDRRTNFSSGPDGK